MGDGPVGFDFMFIYILTKTWEVDEGQVGVGFCTNELRSSLAICLCSSMT